MQFTDRQVPIAHWGGARGQLCLRLEAHHHKTADPWLVASERVLPLGGRCVCRAHGQVFVDASTTTVVANTDLKVREARLVVRPAREPHMRG